MPANRINYFRRYVKNVGKSFGYAAADILKEYNPIVTDVFSDAKGAATSTYTAIKDFAFSKQSSSEKSLLGEIKDSASGTFKNLLDDVKTGNWYNKARDDAATDDMMKALGFDFSDFDFNLDDDASWGEGDDSFSSEEKAIAADKRNTAATIAAMDSVGGRVAKAVNEGNVRSANYISNTIRESSKALYDLNNRGFSQVTLGLNTVNNSIAEFANKIGAPLTTHIQNSTIFFTKTSEQLSKIEQSLAVIAANTTPIGVAGGKTGSSKKPKIEDILSSTTGINLNQYIKYVQANLADYKDTFDMMFGFLKGSLGLGSGKSNLSLGKVGLTAGMKALIPTKFKDSMKEFNNTLADALAGALVKASRRSPNTILGDLLKDILVPTNYFKKNVSTENYEKGAVAWDGKARKALVEVIPTTLFKILGALTGKEMRYNYDTGKFIDVRSIRAEHREYISKNARDAGGKFREKARELAKLKANGNKVLEERYYSELENYFYNAYATDYGYKNFDKIHRSDFNKEKFGISSDEVVNILRAVAASGQANSYFRTNASTRAKQKRELLEKERSGDDIFLSLVNGSYNFDKAEKSGNKLGFGAKGSLGYYIKGIYEHTGFIAANLSKLAGGAGRRGSTTTVELTSFGSFDPTKVKQQRKLTLVTNTEKLAGMRATVAGERTRDESNRVLGIEDFATEDEYANYLREQKKKKANQELTERQKSIKEKLMSVFKGVPSGVLNVFNGPFNAATKLLDTITGGFNTFLWGDPNGTDKGFFGTMKDKLSETFKSITDSFKDTTKNMFKRIFEGIFGTKDENGRRVGGFFGKGLGADIKSELGKSVTWLSDTGREILYGEEYVNALRRHRAAADNGGAAKGRKVTRSGIVSVSEGELIIPSEYNPYYRGVTNKASQIRKENENTLKYYSGKGGIGNTTTFYGNFAKGTFGINTNTAGGIVRNAGDVFKIGNSYFIVDENGRSLPLSPEEGKKRYEEFIKTGHNRMNTSGQVVRNAGGEYVPIKGFMGSVVQPLQKSGADIAREVNERFFDDDGTEQSKKRATERDKWAIKQGLLKIGKEAKSYRGAIGAGAIIGAGASLVTGMVGGPLLGAAVGAAAGLTMRSQVVQDFLFGKTDENGNYTSGVFSKEFGEELKKTAPGIAKGGAVGTIGGLFLGSPVLGAVVGSSIGYVSKSEKAQKVLFGDIDNPTALGTLKNKIKERIPGITVGAAAGLLAGPFGVTGNLLLGAGLGYVTTSEKVKNFFLGEKDSNGKRVGGFLSELKTKVFDNIYELFRNTGNAALGFTKKVGRRLGRFGRNLMSSIAKKAAKSMSNTGTGRKILGLARGLTEGVVDRTGRIVGAFSRRRQRKNLGKGYDVYDKRLGRNLTASERIALREERGFNTNNTTNRFDEFLANVQSEEDLNRINDTINTLINPEKTSKQMRNNSATMLYNGLSDNVNAKQIVKLMQSGDIVEAERLIKNQGGSDADLDLLHKAASTYSDAGKQQKNAKDTLRHWAQAYGIDFTGNPDQLANIQDLIKTERGRFKDEKSREENQPGTFKYRVLHALENIAGNVESIGQSEGADVETLDGKTAKQKNDERRRFEDLVKVTEGRYDPRKFQEGINDLEHTAEDNIAAYQNDPYYMERQAILNKYDNGLGQYESGFNRFRRKLNKNALLAGLGIKSALSKTKRDLSTDATAIGLKAKKGLKGIGNYFARNINAMADPNAVTLFERIGGKIKGSIADSKDAAKNRDLQMYEFAKKQCEAGYGGQVVFYRNAWRTYEQIKAGLKKELNIEDKDKTQVELENEFFGTPEPVVQAAYGLPYARRGLASVSRGELILPSPFYGHYAEGGVIDTISDFAKKNLGVIKSGGFMSTKVNDTNTSASDPTNSYVTNVDFMGNPHTYMETENGLQEVTNNSITDNSRFKMENFYEAIMNISKMNAAQLAIAGAGAGITEEQMKQLMAANGSDNNTSLLGSIFSKIAGAVGTGVAGLFGLSFVKKIFGGGKAAAAATTGSTKTSWAQKLLMKISPRYKELALKNMFANPDVLTLNEKTFNAYQYMKDSKLGIDFTSEELSQYGFKVNADGTYVDAAGKTHESIMQDADGIFRDTDTLEAINTKVDDVLDNIEDVSKGFDSFGIAGDKASVSSTAKVDKANDAVDTIKNYNMSGMDKMDDALDAAGNLKGTGLDVKGPGKISRLKSWMSEKFTALKNSKVGGAVSKVTSKIKNAVKTGASAVKTVAGTGAKAVKTAKSAAVNFVKSTYNKLKSGVAALEQTKVGSKVIGASKKAFKFVLKHIGKIIIVAMVIGAIWGAIQEASKMTDAEVQEFITSELTYTQDNTPYEAIYNNVGEFKKLVESDKEAAAYFMAHPCGAEIRVNGGSIESDSCNVVFPYMVYAPATKTFFHQDIYVKARMRGKFSGSEWMDSNDNPTIYHYLDYSTSKFIGIGVRRLNSCSTCMVKNFDYFRSYTVGTQTDLISRFMGLGSSSHVQAFLGAAVDSLSGIAADVLSLGFYSVGDLSAKKYVMTDYNYKNATMKSDAGEGVIPFEDAFFSPLKSTLGLPSIGDYANSQLDWAKGVYEDYRSTGSNTLVSSGSEVIDTESGLATEIDAKVRSKANALKALSIASTYGDLPESAGNIYGPWGLDGGTYTTSTIDYYLNQWNKNRDTTSRDYIERIYDYHKSNKNFTKTFSGKEQLYQHDYADEFFLKNWFDVADAMKDESGGRSGLSKLKGAGYSPFINQNTGKYRNVSYGKSNINAIGCAPAAAANLSKLLGAGISMDEAIKVGRKYTDNNGTTMDYFSDVFNKAGYGTNMLASKEAVAQSLANNNPVVLLGKDSNNTSKKYSSFGPHPHYVVGSGMNPDGTVNVIDSETDTPQSYNLSKILNGTIAAMNAYPSGGAYKLENNSIGGSKSTSSAKKNAVEQAQAGREAAIKNSSTNSTSSAKKSAVEQAQEGRQAAINNSSSLSTGFSDAEDTSTMTASPLSIISDMFNTAFGRAFGMNTTSQYNAAYGGTPTTATGTNNRNYSSNPVVAMAQKVQDKVNAPQIPQTKPQPSEVQDRLQQMIDYAKANEYTENYSQEAREKQGSNGKWNSDCSSWSTRMYKQFLGVNLGGWTGGIYDNAKAGKNGLHFVDFRSNRDGNYQAYGDNNRQIGDIVLFRSQNSDGTDYQNKSDSTNRYGLSHVELYAGNGQLIGQTNQNKNGGPSLHGWSFFDKSYGNRYLGTIRYTPEESGGRSGLMSYNPNLSHPAALTTGYKAKDRNVYSGGASTTASTALDTDYVTRDTKQMLTDIQSAIVAKGRSGEMSNSLVGQLLMAIVEILKAIATNTSSVGSIYTRLSEFNTNVNANSTSTSSKSSTKAHNNGRSLASLPSFTPSASLQNLVNGLAALAK